MCAHRICKRNSKRQRQRVGEDHARVVRVGGVDEWVRASRDSLLSVAAAGNAIATTARMTPST